MSLADPEALAALADDLGRELAGEVRRDAGSRLLYAYDASNHRRIPVAVAFPRDADDVEAALAVCRRHGAPLLARGAGTSLAGQGVTPGVVLDFSRHMHRVLDVDPEAKTARVEPGAVLDRLQDAAGVHGLAFGPDPSTHAVCTLGGMLGNNACGVHSVRWGRTSDNVHEMEVLTRSGARFRVGATPPADYVRIVGRDGEKGEIYRRLQALAEDCGDRVRAGYPKIPRRVSGYNLDELLPENGFHVARALVGSEGTCATILEATVRLVDRPPARVVLLLAWPDLADAADRVPEILDAGGPRVTGLEGLDGYLVASENVRRNVPRAVSLFPQGDGHLLVEVSGDSREQAAETARRLLERFDSARGRVLEASEDQRAAWRVREEALGSLSRHPELGDSRPGFEDSAVAPERLGDYLRAFRGLLDRHDLSAALYGHFGDGCVHAKMPFDLTSRPGIARYRAFMEEATDLVKAHGGVLSGEHGDGQARGELLERLYGPGLVRDMERFRAIWDPEEKMNPGAVVHPRPLDADLRYPDPETVADPATVFRFPEDDGSFARAVSRCVGVGKCRQASGGVMCPSYRVTKDETHVTRGRARLLGEMLRGDEAILSGGFRNRQVKEALDLCLSCKACKRECPAGVDVATYKAEFQHQHYKRRLRPRSAYVFGLLPWWVRLATAVPALVPAVNALMRGPAAAMVKAVAGVAPERDLPAFAQRTFRRWFTSRPEPAGGRRPVVLFPDTLTDVFQPSVGRAVTEALEEAGFWVRLPSKVLCCGRPLYDVGMLKLARRRLRRVMDALAPEIAAGVPVVVPEPSCAAVFRDELGNLYPDEPAARSLAELVVTPSELFLREGWEPPRRQGRALLHVHCHERAVLTAEADRRYLEARGLDVEVLDAGCCGLAGSFGFEAGDKYRVSMDCAEQALLPAIRDAGEDTLLVSGGFSCREQIRHGTGRTAVHPWEVGGAE